VVPTPAITPVSNYFRSVRRQWNPRVPLRLPCQELRPGVFDSSIQPMVHLQSTILCSAPARVVFSGEPPPLLYLGFLRFSIFPSMQGPSPSPAATPLPLWLTAARPPHARGPPPAAPVRPADRLGPAVQPPPLPSPSHGSRRKMRKKMVILQFIPCLI
jgi:hypothetical protein